ncbi:cytochrome b/b6 domain-containing protein [Pseudoruegeria sp. SK021]|uniref:cytochrome b/b6 domain-containing protein n=1 Tax=Pseudoruegeria sp. SK021 TaxID=1933035 RepID=UPI000A222BF8|nr:cytochrome b/b6 domain-containing protein [Pseudoruegeria sp. SK021]OSP54929.1 cytochrome [Pseudoruegeria sp. SK021]
MATSRFRNTPRSYGAVTKTFHWLTALLILTELPLGLIANDMAYDTSNALALKGTLFSLHKTIGITIFAVALLRILWAITQPKPVLLHPDRRIESWLAETVHWLLYISLVIVPLSGWISHAASAGFAPIWWPFGQGLPLVPQDPTLSHFFGGLHEVFTKVLAASVVLHIIGALKHHVIDRDLTLTRMLPGHTEAGGTPAPHHKSPILAAVVIYGVAIAIAAGLSLTAPETSAIRAPTAPSPATQPSGWTVQEGHLGISVTQFGAILDGSFSDWSAAITFDPEAAGSIKGTVAVDIAIGSLTLGTVTTEALKHEFFDAATFPTATFHAEIIADPSTPDAYLADGTLTLKGREVPLTLPFTLTLTGGVAAMTGTTTVDRRNFLIGTDAYGDEKTVAFQVDVSVALTATETAP